jgi:hypothetical protein
MIVAQFYDYGAAHRAFCELIQFGIAPRDISIIAGDRSNLHGANRDFGLLATRADDYVGPVRRGLTLLAVRPETIRQRRVAEIIEYHAPVEIEHHDAGNRADDRGPLSDTPR